MLKTEKTRDHNKFFYMGCNRPIDRNHVARLKHSIEMNNLLEFCPILVNEKMEIIDGQHRLEAARELGVPIFYQVKYGANDELIPLLNANKKGWKIEEFVHYYANKGVESYRKLIEVANKYQLALTDVIMFFGDNGSVWNVLRDGKFIIKAEDPDVMIENVMQILKNLMKVLNSEKRSFIKSKTFKRSLIVFLKNDEVDAEKFIKKVEIRAKYINYRRGVADYVEMWAEIYNYKVRRDQKLDFAQIRELFQPNMLAESR